MHPTHELPGTQVHKLVKTYARFGENRSKIKKKIAENESKLIYKLCRIQDTQDTFSLCP
jgi:hypothetical protein